MLNPSADVLSQTAPPEPNQAVAAVEALQRWLNLSIEQVADLVGVSRSAVHYWKRENKLPRPGAARNLYRVHALVRAVQAATAPDPALNALARRPDDGGPSAYELLLQGRYDSAERLIRPLIFRRDRQPVQRRRLVEQEPGSLPASSATALTLSRPMRRARRVALPK